MCTHSGPAATETRAFLETCFSRLTTRIQAKVKRRIQSGDAKNIDALIHELVSHELLYRLRFDPEIEPKIDGLTPDFSITISGVEFLVDVLVAYNPSRTVFEESEHGLGTVDCGDRAKKYSASDGIGLSLCFP